MTPQQVEDHAYTGLAESYQKVRPSYPPALIAAIVAFAGPALASGALVVDVGAGTGIATRALAAALPAGCDVLGVEPNDDMRAKAEAAVSAGSGIRFAAGAADALPVADGAAALLTAAQAAHWFDRPRFYTEALRVLRPGGVIGIFENNRDWRRSALLDVHEGFLEAHAVRRDGSRYSRFYRDHPYAQELLRAFGNVVAEQFTWIRRMSVADFVAMAKTSTQVQAAIANLGDATATARMLAYAAEHADAEGMLDIPYTAELHRARKRVGMDEA